MMKIEMTDILQIFESGYDSAQWSKIILALSSLKNVVIKKAKVQGSFKRPKTWERKNDQSVGYHLLGERSEPLHTSESQLRLDMCICLYHKNSKVNACPFPAAMFKRQH